MSVPVRERVSWLLRVNRRLAPDPAMRAGKTFAAAFRLDGERPLAPSQVTRWEDGTVAPRRETILRYEELLRLPHDSLTSLKDAVDRLAGATQPTVVDLRADRLRFHALLERATAAAEPMTGRHWGELTEIIQGSPGLVLHPPRVWETLSHRLLGELVVAENTAWLQRQEAMSRLLEHPDSGAAAVHACISLAEDRSSPVVVEPLSLLDATAHPDANRQITRIVAAADDGRALYGALLASVRKVRAGHFSPDELGRLGAAVTELLADRGTPGTVRPLAFEVSRRINGLPVREKAPAGPRHPLVVAQRAAHRAAADVLPGAPDADRTLTLLIDDALHSANPDERMMAGMFIAATPYRAAVARVLFGDLLADLRRRQDGGLSSTLRTLTILGATEHRTLIEQILTGQGFSESARHAAAWATPHAAGSFDEATWRRILQAQLRLWRVAPAGLGEEILHGVTYGMGTDDHRTLLQEVRADDRLPAAARSTAAWLLTTPAVLRTGF